MIRASRYAFDKYWFYIRTKDFIWTTDCSGILGFFNTDSDLKHVMTCWKFEMLQYDFICSCFTDQKKYYMSAISIN